MKGGTFLLLLLVPLLISANKPAGYDPKKSNYATNDEMHKVGGLRGDEIFLRWSRLERFSPPFYINHVPSNLFNITFLGNEEGGAREREIEKVGVSIDRIGRQTFILIIPFNNDISL